MKHISRTLLLLMSIACIHVFAAEDQPPAEPETETAEQTEQSTSEDASTEVRPDTDLRARTLGEAFKNFTPSEEISADNAVSFPVDI